MWFSLWRIVACSLLVAHGACWLLVACILVLLKRSASSWSVCPRTAIHTVYVSSFCSTLLYVCPHAAVMLAADSNSGECCSCWSANSLLQLAHTAAAMRMPLLLALRVAAGAVLTACCSCHTACCSCCNANSLLQLPHCHNTHCYRKCGRCVLHCYKPLVAGATQKSWRNSCVLQRNSCVLQC